MSKEVKGVKEEVKTYARQVQVELKWNSKPNVDEIEQETDVLKAEQRADSITIEYLQVLTNVEEKEFEIDALTNELNYMKQALKSSAYRFAKARKKYLELKTNANSI